MKRLFAVMTAAALLALAAGVPATAFAGSAATTCTGSLDPGDYQRVVVPEGGSCFSDGPVTIRAGLYIEPGATFVLGSEESPGSTGTISGGVHATDPASVQIHFATINGGIDVHGGSGPFGGPLCFDVPELGTICLMWTAIEDNRINGPVTVDGYDGYWLGFIRNQVNGTVMLTNNVQLDEIDVGANDVHGSLLCSGNVPLENTGGTPGTPLSQVTGRNTCNPD